MSDRVWKKIYDNFWRSEIDFLKWYVIERLTDKRFVIYLCGSSEPEKIGEKQTLEEAMEECK